MAKLTVESLLELMDRKNVTIELNSDYSGSATLYPQSKILFYFSIEQELIDGLNELEDFTDS